MSGQFVDSSLTEVDMGSEAVGEAAGARCLRLNNSLPLLALPPLSLHTAIAATVAGERKAPNVKRRKKL